MIHFTCDCCQKSIDTEHEMRYVVRMEIYSALDLDEGADEQLDQLEEIDELLEQLDGQGAEAAQDLYHQARYDLCAACREKFLKNPLGRVALAKMGFSEN